jgi:hypothetical protein
MSGPGLHEPCSISARLAVITVDFMHFTIRTGLKQWNLPHRQFTSFLPSHELACNHDYILYYGHFILSFDMEPSRWRRNLPQREELVNTLWERDSLTLSAYRYFQEWFPRVPLAVEWLHETCLVQLATSLIEHRKWTEKRDVSHDKNLFDWRGEDRDGQLSWTELMTTQGPKGGQVISHQHKHSLILRNTWHVRLF